MSQWNVRCNVMCFLPSKRSHKDKNVFPKFYTHSRLCVTVRAPSWTSGHNIGHFQSHFSLTQLRSRTSDFLWSFRSRKEVKKKKGKKHFSII